MFKFTIHRINETTWISIFVPKIGFLFHSLLCVCECIYKYHRGNNKLVIFLILLLIYVIFTDSNLLIMYFPVNYSWLLFKLTNSHLVQTLTPESTVFLVACLFHAKWLVDLFYPYDER